MAQITGSSTGHMKNYAMVDSSVGVDTGRLYTTGSVSDIPNIVIDKAKIRGSGLVMFPKQEDRMINGNLYQAGSYIQNMPLDTSGAIFLCTGSNDVHFAFDARTDGDAIFNFYEGTRVSNSGTVLPIFNRNRHAANLGSVIDAKLFVDPTLTSVGDIIHTAMFLGGSGTGTKFQSATVALAPSDTNWLLEAGSCYYFQFVNICGRDMNVDFNIVMHEHGHA